MVCVTTAEGNEALLSDQSTSARAEWQSCRARTRCTRGARYVTGADIVRISRTLALEPWKFTQTAPATAGDPTGIVLDKGRRRVTLKLANAAHGCVFSILTPSGAACCGLGDIAPVACRIFPIDPKDGVPRVRPERTCDCHEWKLEDLDRGAVVKAMSTWTADRDHWFELVERWNALAAESDEESDIKDFQRYLLEAQSAREAGAGWPEDVTA
ncbi:hypothetical protein Airi02_044470 [Actinoallomurus iriomotensis]|uniref:YkgJ family cysteine cluster protein n=1 Tax=Actinoallomurus iriomotensis TaxID=478107 RepID=A0A9W6S3J7_9ACTN|nr:hypothetical protein Airi02_044470 [Actinoallomurus iriomotensis]